MSKEREKYSSMSPLKRCALAESIFIVYPRLRSLIKKIEHCHQYSKIAAEPECMFIGGLPGAGKTTIQNYYLRQFPRAYHENGATVPVLGARVPNRANDKTLVTELLLEIKDPEAIRGSAHNQTTRLRGFLKECCVELIILDEFQHFVDKDSKRVLKTVSDWLKDLIDKAGKPIVVIGMPYADQILDAEGNEQLQRRFSVREELSPFGWSEKGQRNEFRSFLKALDDQLPLIKASRLADPEMAFRLYCATNGRVGKIMKIVRRATELAIEQSIECLTLDTLADAYADRLQAEHPNRPNALRANETELKIIPFEELVPDFRVTNGRSKAKERKETAFNVLSKK